ncbi:SGNH/GDSL hydrolase family protein [Paracidovorax avenae]
MAYSEVVYWSQEELQQVPANATILAFGDSWFHYPMYGGSLVNSIGDLVKSSGRRILVTGKNGLEIRQFSQGFWQKRFRNVIRLYGSTCEAILISGGGNDFAGFDDLRPLLNGNCKTAQTAQECFRPGDGEFTLKDLEYKVYRSYAQFITEASLTIPASAKFFVHNYDYAPVTGKGVFGKEGWIRPALEDAQVPPGLYDACVKLIIDGHSRTLDTLQKALPDRVVFIDGRGTLQPEDWANELHPTGQGFAKMVQVRWKAPLDQAGLTT